MVVQNIMYFVLGFLASGLLALMIIPSIWHRAVRLTKTRIEAATPMTMNEFRADKDQLRAEFALSTRRLEKNVEALRERLASQLSEINRNKTDLVQLRSDRDEKQTIVNELEARESELRRKVQELEIHGADLAQRLRMRDREFNDLSTQLQQARSQGSSAPDTQHINRLLQELAAERQRAEFFQEQVTSLTSRLAGAEQGSSDAAAAAAQMRQALAANDTQQSKTDDGLTEAETRIANAEMRLNALLEETQIQVEGEKARVSQLLAEKFSLEDELARLREKISIVENAVYNDWEQERIDQSHLHERLNDIASDVSRLVYAVDDESMSVEPESLFDRVKKFSADDLNADAMSIGSPSASKPSGKGRLADRMAALRDLQST